MTLPRPEHFSDWKAWAAEAIRREQSNPLAKQLGTILAPSGGVTFVYNQKLDTITIVGEAGLTDGDYGDIIVSGDGTVMELAPALKEKLLLAYDNLLGSFNFLFDKEFS